LPYLGGDGGELPITGSKEESGREKRKPETSQKGRLALRKISARLDKFALHFSNAKHPEESREGSEASEF
jgi:hypothetical protein